MSYDHNILAPHIDYLVKDGAGVLPTVGIMEEIPTAVADHFDSLETIWEYEAPQRARNAAVRNSNWVFSVSDTMVRLTKADHFAYVGWPQYKIDRLQELLTLKMATADMFNFFDMNFRVTNRSGGVSPFRKGTTQAANHLTEDWGYDIARWLGIEAGDVLSITRVVGTNKPLASPLRDAFYDGSSTRGYEVIHHAVVPDDECWITFPVTLLTDDTAGYNSQLALMKLPRTGVVAHVVAVQLWASIGYGGDNDLFSTYATPDNAADYPDHVFYTNAVRFESSWEDVIDLSSAHYYGASIGKSREVIVETDENVGSFDRTLGALSDEGLILSGGLRREGIRWETKKSIGTPTPGQDLTWEGEVVVSSTTAGPTVFTVGSGPRSFTYNGPDIVPLLDATEPNSENEVVVTQEDLDELASLSIRTIFLPTQISIAKPLVSLTNAAAMADEADIDIFAEIFQEADAEKGAEQLTFAQAENKADGVNLRAWYVVVDNSPDTSVQAGTITISGTEESATITVKDHLQVEVLSVGTNGLTDEHIDIITDYYWAGSKQVDNSTMGYPFADTLAIAMGVTGSSLSKATGSVTGTVNEFDEAAVFAAHHSHLTLSESQFAAQKLMQGVHNRNHLGELPVSLIGYARMSAKSLGLNKIQ